MNKIAAGYREVAHTADWQLDVWAPDFAGLLEQAARGMYALAGVQIQTGSRHEHRLDLHAVDRESVLVSFLTELLFLLENERLGFYEFHLEADADTLVAHLVGAPLLKLDKEIKAVTYHNLELRQESHGLHASIVFDV